ncbi:hypothetical protein C4553_01785 [Candidatus Parcubacteria bacterium]|nr:MAG: hypothetical protein C4553_01785 [Candidatus Parcubacteria bacterium]
MENRQVVFVEAIIKDEELKAGQNPRIRPNELLERGLEARRAEGWCDVFALPLPTPDGGQKWAIVFHRHNHLH